MSSLQNHELTAESQEHMGTGMVSITGTAIASSLQPSDAAQQILLSRAMRDEGTPATSTVDEVAFLATVSNHRPWPITL
jgi:hypothetical protein